ncbi:MAG: hypothetical protein IKH38_06100 [Clostridia bacterium]|nr:hypothetical protein [Clostridia bacterium]
MKRLLLGVLLCAALLIFGAAALAEANTTLLVYMVGTDIETSACVDLLEMADAKNDEEINIVVLAGGTKKWRLQELKGGVRNLAVIRNGRIDTVTSWGRKSMGSAQSLSEFLTYGLKEYPAQRTMLVLWDHGAGSEGGVCFDEMWGDDGLSITEINQALSMTEQEVGDFHLDLFGCDACLMATYEMAAMLSGYQIDWFVASQEVEPSAGWEYSSWLKELGRDPFLPTEVLCRRIADTYMKASLRKDPDDMLTMSAVSLRRMRELRASVEDFAIQLTGCLQEGNLAEVRRARSRMYAFGSKSDDSWDMVDLAAVLKAYEHLAPEESARAQRCLREAVLVNTQTENLDTCSGLSILIPQDTTDSFRENSDGFELSFCAHNWADFVRGYVSLLQGGSYTFSASVPVRVVEEEETPFFPLQSAPETVSYEASPPEEETAPATAAAEYQFTAQLNPEDLKYLDDVEGLLLLDGSDEEIECYVDLGTLRNNRIDWETGTVYSLFDGSWPVLGDQLVPVYDQVLNERIHRSLIPVKVNGERTYLVVDFSGDGTGRVLGTNAGYDSHGLPIRDTLHLQPGDRVIPVYTMFYRDDAGEIQETDFDGDEFLWEEDMTVTHERLEDEQLMIPAYFCFSFTDLFGNETLGEMIAFEF